MVCNPKTSLLTLLREFKKGKSHLALITEHVTEFENKQSLSKKFGNQKSEKKSDINILGMI